MYSYSVELVGLQSTDYSTDTVQAVDGDLFARFYEPPSKLFPVSDPSPVKKQKDQNKNHCLELYGLEERKTLSDPESSHLALRKCKENGRQCRFTFGFQEQRKFIQKYFNGSVPHFICNMSTLKILMTQNIDFKLRATVLRLPDGRSCIYLKYYNLIKSTKFRRTGILVENVLAVNEVEYNHVLEAVYSARLSASDQNGCNTSYHIGFIAETDGIWNCKLEDGKDGNRKEYEANDLVEVKSLRVDNFYSSREKKSTGSKRRNYKQSHFNHYHYEEEILRLYWAHCYLRGIEKLLCAILDRANGIEKIKEIWLYNVNKIPSLLAKEHKNARPFPKVGFKSLSVVEQRKFTELHQTLNWEEWNEQTEFHKLFTALDEINGSLRQADCTQAYYFVCTKQKGLKLVSELEFEQF